jgi:hypothetical protein
MPKQPAEPKKSALARPDPAVVRMRKEAAQRVEELKLKLMVLAERHFEQSLRIIKYWLKDGETDKTQKKR